MPAPVRRRSRLSVGGKEPPRSRAVRGGSLPRGRGAGPPGATSGQNVVNPGPQRKRRWTLGRAPAYSLCSTPHVALNLSSGGSMRTRLWRAASIAALSWVALSRAASADLLVNGNFEDGPAMPPSNPIFAVAPGDATSPGWTVRAGIVCVVSDGYWVPLSGQRSMCLSDNRPLSGATVGGSISQTFASAPGATYRLTFWVSGEPFTTPTIKHLRV